MKTGQEIVYLNGKYQCFESCSAGSLSFVDQPSTLTCDVDKFKAEDHTTGAVGCYTCPAGMTRAEHDGNTQTVRCYSEDELGCVTCPAGKQLLCSGQYASVCECYDTSAMGLVVPTCVADGVETVATERATIIGCVSTVGCKSQKHNSVSARVSTTRASH